MPTIADPCDYVVGVDTHAQHTPTAGCARNQET